MSAKSTKSVAYRHFFLTFPQPELRLDITSDPFQDRMGPEPRNRHRSLASGPFYFLSSHSVGPQLPCL